MKASLIERISCLFAISLFTPCHTFGCSTYYVLHQVRQTFTVIVRDRGKQMAGIDVALLRWDDVHWRYEVVKSVQTNIDGKAVFFDAPLGEFRVKVSHRFIAGGDAEVKVVNRGKTEDKIALAWPAAEVHQVRVVMGTFSVAVTNEPLSGADVSLTEIGTSRVVGKTVSNQRGRFDFDGVRPGLYALSISERTEEEGYLGIIRDIVFERLGIQQKHVRPERARICGNILIEVNDKAIDRELARGALSMTSCGMWYESQRAVRGTN